LNKQKTRQREAFWKQVAANQDVLTNN